MFKTQGENRTLKQNLQIATILSFVAGIVNVTGILSFSVLTTNVTGHFALFINDVAEFQFWKGTIYFLYIFSFLFGSFLSSFLILKFKSNKKINVYLLPTIIEFLILLVIGFYSVFVTIKSPNLIVCLLLLAMGIQNSFVTKISNAVVRTTHLTGLFTDLGIDISQLFFKESLEKRAKLKSNIILRVYIISSFFAGGLVGGFFYSRLNFKLQTLLLAALILLLSLFYDGFRNKLSAVKKNYY